MTVSKMHADEVDIDIDLVQRLLTTQFPQWAGLPIKPVNSSGTDNMIYRLGNDMVIRLPRIASSAPHIDKEYQWLPYLTPHVPLATPIILGKGMPIDEYPWPWLIYRWIDGKNSLEERITDLDQAAADLGHFVTALQKIDITGAPRSDRGLPLISRDRDTRIALNTLHSIIDVNAATTAWEIALGAPEWNAAPVWIHADLQPGNLLVKEGKLNAVIDFGLAGIGDPACDMMVAWTLLSVETRDIFRAIVQPDDATWARGRGWALTFGLVALPYYRNTNPVLADIARHTIDEVLADKK